MATELRVRVEESNGIDHAYCPHCSMMYAALDEKGKKLSYPEECSRCGSPMDFQKGYDFGEELAKNYTKAIRVPVRTAVIKEAPRSK